jgi:hypothetical protein
MARHDGPIKGTITLVCSETAESSTFITEPIAVTTEQYGTLEACTLEVSATIAADATQPIKYFAPAVTTVGTPVVTGVRQMGSTKGMLVFVNDTDAVSSSYILEPLILTKVNYDAVIAGTRLVQATMFTDGLGHKFFEATSKAV